MNRWLVYYPGRLLRGENVYRYQKLYEETQWWSEDRLREFQWKKLKKLLHYAYENVPFYERKFKEIGLHPADIRSLEDYEKIPLIITRDDFIQHGNELQSRVKTGKYSVKVTGGTTAQPARIYKDRRAVAMEDAAMWRALEWWGIRVGDRQARFWGIAIDKGTNAKIALIDFLMNRKRISAMNFTEESLWNYYLKIKKFEPQYFYGYPSLILRFTETLVKHNVDPHEFHLKGIVTTAEPIYPAQINYLKRQYGAPHINDYGSSELGPITYSCREGSMHLMAENLYAEIVDENGKPVPEGITGYLLLTDLNNYAMPILRYKINDITSKTTRKCSCGRGLPVYEQVTGRILNLLQATDGSFVHGGFFYYIIEDMVAQGMGNIQLQAIQESPRRIRLNIVPNPTFGEKELQFLIQKLKVRFGQDMQFQINFVKELTREPSGKLFITKNLISRQ